MPELRFKLHPQVAEAVRETVEAVALGLRNRPARELPPAGDPELEKAWRENLLELLRGDMDRLLALLGREGFGSEPVRLSEEEADRTMRACSAVRLRLRETVLAEVEDHELETGEIRTERLEPYQQQAYGCYVFLAGLQEVLVRNLLADGEDQEEPGGP